MSASSSRSNNYKLNKAPPFLQLSRDTIQNYDTKGLDIENVLSVWLGLTRCSSYIKDGKRLENISWRIVNRNMIDVANKRAEDYEESNLSKLREQEGNDTTKINDNNNNNNEDHEVTNNESKSNQTQQQQQQQQQQQHHHHQYKRKRNELNNGDLLSLLSIVADQNLIPPVRPQLIRKKSSNTKLKRNNSKNSLKSIDLMESNRSSRPNLLSKKSSSSKSLKRLNSRTNNNRRSNVDLPTLSNDESQSNLPLPQSIKVEHDSDLFEQPNPKYAFGVLQAKESDNQNQHVNITDPSNENKPQAPPLTRSDTSTSVVRGFSPYHISVAQLSSGGSNSNSNSQSSTQSSPKKQSQQHSAPSLFDQNQNLKNPQPKRPHSAVVNTTKSLFNHSNSSQYNDRVKSPLSQETTHEILKNKQPTSLFQSSASTTNSNSTSHQQQKQKTGTLFDHSALHENNHNINNIHQNQPIKSSLFEQVGISPEAKRHPHPHPQPSQNHQSHHQAPVQQQHKKRTNVLNNLGMTSLAAKQHAPQRKDKNNMFFIESSPSPTGPSRLIDHQTQQQQQQQHQHQHNQQPRQRSKSRRHHRRKRSSSSESKRDSLQDSISSLAGSEISEKDEDQYNEDHKNDQITSQDQQQGNNNTSLFADKKPISREIIFSSDDSLSDESDWSSVSESEGSDESDEHDLKKQWQSSFQRDEPLPKPQIKRSLLSGLFLNEMQEQHHHQQFQQPQSGRTSSSSTQLHSRQPSGSQQQHPHQLWKSNNNSQDHDLGTSISSSNLVVKHRHRPPSINSTQTTRTVSTHSHQQPSDHDLNDDALEISSTEPHTVISTSNVNVSGQVSEPTHFNSDQKALRDKLAGTQDAVQPGTSFSKMISNSALNLTNYFASRRKNSFSSIASDRTRTKYRHESNAPPTAATLLPTALSTHMFLPNAHQKRVKSKLSSVLESDSGATSSNDVSRKNSQTEQQHQHQQQQSLSSDNNEAVWEDDPLRMAKSPTVPIVSKKPLNVEIEGLQSTDQIDTALKNFNISRKLSPKTTRRQMLATELSDSMRKSILWDRKNGVPTNHHNHNNNHHHHDGHNQQQQQNQKDEFPKKEGNGHVNGESKQDEDEDKISSVTELVQDPTDPNKPKIVRSKIENFNDEDWDASGTDFYTRGW